MVNRRPSSAACILTFVIGRTAIGSQDQHHQQQPSSWCISIRQSASAAAVATVGATAAGSQRQQQHQEQVGQQ